MAHIEASAAIFFGHGQTKQAHLAHFIDDYGRDRIVLDYFRLCRDQPLAHIALQLLGELLEDVAIHTGVAPAFGRIDRLGCIHWLKALFLIAVAWGFCGLRIAGYAPLFSGVLKHLSRLAQRFSFILPRTPRCLSA